MELCVTHNYTTENNAKVMNLAGINVFKSGSPSTCFVPQMEIHTQSLIVAPPLSFL